MPTPDFLLHILYSDSPKNPRREGLARKAMLKWVKHKNKSRDKPAAVDVEVGDFGSAWRDGRAFHALLHSIEPSVLNSEQVMKSTNKENLEAAFRIAEDRVSRTVFKIQGSLGL